MSLRPVFVLALVVACDGDKSGSTPPIFRR